jgi:hypothetical protein
MYSAPALVRFQAENTVQPFLGTVNSTSKGIREMFSSFTSLSYSLTEGHPKQFCPKFNSGGWKGRSCKRCVVASSGWSTPTVHFLRGRPCISVLGVALNYPAPVGTLHALPVTSRKLTSLGMDLGDIPWSPKSIPRSNAQPG